MSGWVTINGNHVLIGADGVVTKGPKALVGKTVGSVKKSAKSSETGSNSKPKSTKTGTTVSKSDKKYKETRLQNTFDSAINNAIGGTSADKVMLKEGYNQKSNTEVHQNPKTDKDFPKENIISHYAKQFEMEVSKVVIGWDKEHNRQKLGDYVDDTDKAKIYSYIDKTYGRSHSVETLEEEVKGRYINKALESVKGMGSGKYSDDLMFEAFQTFAGGDVYSGFNSTEIRHAQTGKSGSIKHAILADAIEDAIKVAPGTNKPLYRGIRASKDYVSSIKVGEKVDFRGMSSWSESMEKASSFSKGLNNEKRVVFILPNGAKQSVRMPVPSSNFNSEKEHIVSKDFNNATIGKIEVMGDITFVMLNSSND